MAPILDSPMQMGLTMKTFSKVAWVVSENATYLNFLGRYVEDGGFIAKKFLSWEEMKDSYPEASGQSPDLILLHTLRNNARYQEKCINYVMQINPMQTLIPLSNVKLMATVQAESSFDHNEIGSRLRNMSQRRLVKSVSIINVLTS